MTATYEQIAAALQAICDALCSLPAEDREKVLRAAEILMVEPPPQEDA